VYTFPGIAQEGMRRIPSEASQVLNGQLSYSDLLGRLKMKIRRKLGIGGQGSGTRDRRL
ncbi:MAG: hypothetical protein HYU64_15840, partial [Armatimonadetes bacterium]|nr:hypothetical protein [Armatimonadota bacterium]